MKITIGKFAPASRTVPVTFEHGGVRHERPVNACTDAAGKYDKAATAARVDDVASGVAHKIAIGAITNPPTPE
jgi:hypothetical protein